MEENKEEKNYGHVTVGAGSPYAKEIKVAEFVRARFIDDRLVGVAKLEDDTFFISVENYASSGREPKSVMRLTKESLIGLLATCHLYFGCKKEDLDSLLTTAVDGGKMRYAVSDNINPSQTHSDGDN
jgi:hypothetical protein